VIAFLASPRSGHITGATVAADGGRAASERADTYEKPDGERRVLVGRAKKDATSYRWHQPAWRPHLLRRVDGRSAVLRNSHADHTQSLEAHGKLLWRLSMNQRRVI